MLTRDVSPGDAGARTRGGMTAALVSVIVAGSALRLWQYGANGALWVDELALVRGILAADLRELLTTPLLHNQVAPKGFLLVEKLAVSAFGPSEYALRLFPLLCSLIALVVFVRLSARLLGGVVALAASVLFATATPLVASAALVKQYSTDVCVAVLLWQLAYSLSTRTVKPRWAALLGALLVWFSNPAALMTVALGTALLMWPGSGSNERGQRRELLLGLACWWASSLAATIATFLTTTHATRDYMRWFWAGGFAPSAPAQFFKTLWPLERISSIFEQGQIFGGMGYPAPAAYAALVLLGLAWLWRHDKRLAALLTTPLLFTLAAAVFRQYPFSDRLVHFLLPGLLLAMAAAVECARKLLWHRSRVLGTLAVALLLLPAVCPLAATPPPYYTEPVKPVLAYLRQRRQPGDAVYIYYGAALAVTFYAPQYGLRREEYLVGGCHRGESRLYLQELDTLRGRPRVWVLLTHAGPVLREREDILAYLDAIGVRQEAVVVEPHGIGRNLFPAEAYLYDLSNSEKSGAVAADTFPLKGPHAPGERLGCGEGTQASLPVDFR